MSYENSLIAQGLWPLCGVDEAGRGPLAGPVSAAAVILKPESPLRDMMADSKKLTPARRDKIYNIIMTSSDAVVGVAMVDEKEIDRINILNASLKAMQIAVSKLADKPVCALIDGNRPPQLDCRTVPIVKGDQSEASIAAASIVAKVTRDRFMLEMDGLYPGYGFAKHKGYPTAAHYAAIRELGPCPIHRRSFKGVCG